MGPFNLSTKAAMEGCEVSSSSSTRMLLLPVEAIRSCTTERPRSALRTARMTSALAEANARAVSTPMPDDAPVITMRLPSSSTPEITSAAVDLSSNLETIGLLISGTFHPRVGGIRGLIAASTAMRGVGRGPRAEWLSAVVHRELSPPRSLAPTAAFHG